MKDELRVNPHPIFAVQQKSPGKRFGNSNSRTMPGVCIGNWNSRYEQPRATFAVLPIFILRGGQSPMLSPIDMYGFTNRRPICKIGLQRQPAIFADARPVSSPHKIAAEFTIGGICKLSFTAFFIIFKERRGIALDFGQNFPGLFCK